MVLLGVQFPESNILIGQFLDVVGFLTIAWEWRYAYRDVGAEMADKIDVMLDKRAAEHAGEEYVETRDFEITSRHVQQWMWQEWRHRGHLFSIGVALVILGFVFQVLGSWPHLFRSC